MSENKLLSDNELENISGGLINPEGKTVNITPFVNLQQYCVQADNCEFHEHMGNVIASSQIRNNRMYYFNTGFGYLKAYVAESFSVGDPSGRLSVNVLKITLPDSGNSVYYCLAGTIIEAYEYK